MCEAFREAAGSMVKRPHRHPRLSLPFSPKALSTSSLIYEGTGLKSQELPTKLLEEAGVACLSGTAFGKFGEGYLRFQRCHSPENIAKALERIDEWVGKHL